MNCGSPKFIRPADIWVPCGKCTACRIDKSREWCTRILHEAEKWENSVFVTFTYDNVDLPESKELSKDELARMWKRLRKELSSYHRKIKYYACGEYGEKNGRPHYHAIVFGMKPCNECKCCNKKKYMIEPVGDCKILYDAWGKGFIWVGDVNSASARYVADYFNKGWIKDGRVAPFKTQSNGLGLGYVMDNKEQIVENLFITVYGKNCGMPRYYRKKLEIDKSFYIKEVSDYWDKEVWPLLERKLKKSREEITFKEIDEYIKEHGKKALMNVEARVALRKSREL